MRLPNGGSTAVSTVLGFLLYTCINAFDHSDGLSPYSGGYAPDVVTIDVGNYTFGEPEDHVDSDSSGNATIRIEQTPQLDQRSAKDFYLRVMPLGASITQGYGSTDGNGYRKWLRAQLRYRGWKVNMVGSKQDGSMGDSDNEGHPGWTIESVHGAWTGSKWMKPNLVLINAGLNDCNPGGDPSRAGERTRSLVEDIFNSVPGVTVIVSTLLMNGNPLKNVCTDNISRQIRNVVAEYRGARIGLADIRSVMSLSDIGPDKDHPTDAGYKLFAGVWWDAISKIEDRIQQPASVNGIDDAAGSSSRQCKKVAGNAGLPVQTQQGSGHEDGNYVHSSTARGTLESAKIDKGNDPQSIVKDIPWHIFFANLVKGDPNADRRASLDDWIRVYHNAENKNAYYYRQNLGGGKFGQSVRFNIDMDCDLGPRYAFADFNNDGFDDFFCLKENAVWVSLNRGGNPPTFESIGQVIGDLGGYKPTDIRIADIDGDGRADFCLLKSAGSIACSRNGGTGDSPQWQGFSTATGIRGEVFNVAQPDKDGIIIADLNGDFRADVMYIGGNGNVRTWINNRGTGNGIVPDWRSAGQTHAGQSTSGVQDRIKFGRIYGSNRLDYILLKEQTDHYDVLVWQNLGSGGTKLKADGNYYCDMRGSGADDYVWIYQDGGAAEINVNIHSPPQWGHNTQISLRVPGPRNGIHLADFNGDGRCDVLVQNKADGTFMYYRNIYDTVNDRITFASPLTLVDVECREGWGVGIFDLGMRFHDIDGDGRADILCIEKNGRVTGWLNTATGFINVGQIKFSEGWDRANMRFADVEGSGRADLLHVDKYNGAVEVFTNNGHSPQGGSSFSWTKRGMLYNPINRGETMHFTNQGGLGRADLVHVDPRTNKAWTYWNRCSSSGGDDDPATTNPGLPATGGGSTPDPPDGDYPKVVDGFCEGPDCHGGVCTGILCVSNGCTGSGCSHGRCTVPSLCIPFGCIGPDCTDGVCVGSRCSSNGCQGPDCDSGSGRCKGDRCISTGCSGSDCDSGDDDDGGGGGGGRKGSGRGRRCRRHSCTGIDCINGICIGPSCHDSHDHNGGGCEGNGCSGGGGGGGESGGDDPNESCSETKTASTCFTTTTSTIFRPATTWTTWSFSDCQTNVGCSVTDSSSSTTIEGTVPLPSPDSASTEYFELSPDDIKVPSSAFAWDPPSPTDFISCSHRDRDPGQGINQGYCVCSSSTFAESVVTYVTPPNSCGYTTKPTRTIDITASPPTSTYTPLTRGPINCFKEADFPGHPSIQSQAQDDFALAFSDLRGDLEDDTVGPGDEPLKLRGMDRSGVHYDYSCEWVRGCDTEVDRQSFGFPLGSPSDITAYLLVREIYTKCNNGGVGGTSQVGCLLYKFEGGRG